MLPFIKNLALVVAAVLAPIQTVLGIVILFIIVDLISGIASSMKRKEPITSAGFRRTVTKIVVYEGALVMAFLAEKYLISDAIPVVKLISSMIGITELKSIMENLNGISGTNLLSSVLSKLNSDNLQ